MRALRHLGAAALVGVAVLAAGCSPVRQVVTGTTSSSPSPVASPSAEPSASPSASPSPAPNPSPSPSPSPSPVVVHPSPSRTAATRPSPPAPVKTTPAAPRRSFTVTPTSGPPKTRVTIVATGCAGPNYGVGYNVLSPSGQTFNGNGGSTDAAGTVTIPDTMQTLNPDGTPTGVYHIAGFCEDNSGTIFNYPPVAFTIT